MTHVRAIVFLTKAYCYFFTDGLLYISKVNQKEHDSAAQTGMPLISIKVNHRRAVSKVKRTRN